MAVKTTIDSVHGLVQLRDNVGGTTIEGSNGNHGFSPFEMPGANLDPATATALGLTFTVASPGYYLVSGSTQCTGTLPGPSTMPSTMIGVTAQNLQPIMLTGSVRNGPGGVFTLNGIASGSLEAGGLVRGDKMNIDAGGSVLLYSDGFYWVPMCSSGTLKLHNT